MDDKQLRIAILTITRDMHPNPAQPIITADYMRRLGFQMQDQNSVERVSQALGYLTSADYVTSRSFPMEGTRAKAYAVTSITAKGIDIVEGSGTLGASRTGTANFFGAVGSVQVGDFNRAHVTQNVGASMSELVDALIALLDETTQDPSYSGVNSLATTALQEATEHKSVTPRFTSLMLSIGQLVQTAGAALPAYQAIYALAPSFNIHGLPPPPKPGG